MKAFTRLFANLFTSPTRETGKMDLYREWHKQRNLAAKYGQSHVDEIDAIFARSV